MHGGTTVSQIRAQLDHASLLARTNYAVLSRQTPGTAAASTCSSIISVLLFFDEANTSEHVGLIKEIMCDGTCLGEPIEALSYGLKIIAAINPYRKHSPEMIQKLEVKYN